MKSIEPRKVSDVNELVDAYNDFVEEFALIMGKLMLGDNFSASIKEGVSIPAGATVEISHSLKLVPKYRIILKQIGNGLITEDVTKPWTEKVIYLKNNGGTDVVATIMILRG